MTDQKDKLWNRISQVAENMRDLPDWKKGSVLNERKDESSFASRKNAPQECPSGSESTLKRT
jgi:hypothetical protein